MGEENLALFVGEFLQSILKLRQQHASGVGRLRSSIAGREQALQCEKLSLVRYYRIVRGRGRVSHIDRKSTRLNSSHTVISYAVFCLKKKNNTQNHPRMSQNESCHIIQQSAQLV